MERIFHHVCKNCHKVVRGNRCFLSCCRIGVKANICGFCFRLIYTQHVVDGFILAKPLRTLTIHFYVLLFKITDNAIQFTVLGQSQYGIIMVANIVIAFSCPHNFVFLGLHPCFEKLSVDLLALFLSKLHHILKT